MSRGEAFCVACGAGPPHSRYRLCETCFRERNTISECEETSQAYRCPKCEMNFEGGRWARLESEDLLQRRLDDSLRIHERAQAVGIATHPEEIDERNVRIRIQVDGQIDAFDFDEEHELIVRTSNKICTTCTRKDGNYYEATMQIRSTGRKLNEDELNELRGSLDTLLATMEPDPMFFITKEGPVVGGWDVTMGSKSLARNWARHMTQKWGGQTKETHSVVGQKDGLDVMAHDIHRRICSTRNLASYYDGSGSIGRRYARADEVGVPWAVTVDHESMQDGTVTIRRRDDGTQVRIQVDDLIENLSLSTISGVF